MDKKSPTAADHWNATYTSGMSEHTEAALHKAYNELEARPVRQFGDCGETSARVHSVLKREGINSRVVSGQFGAGHSKKQWNKGTDLPLSRDHVWLEVDGHVIDPTAGQFRGQVKGNFKRQHYWEH
jgi:hypothetical protein